MTFHPFGLRALSLFAVLVAPVPLHAEVYKWVDEQGNVHYGDRPGNAQSEQVQIQESPQADPDAAERMERSQKILNEYSDERAEEKKKQEAKAQEETQRKANCERARKNLDLYEHAGRLYVKDENGERHNLTDDEYQKAMESSRAEVKKWCGS